MFPDGAAPPHPHGRQLIEKEEGNPIWQVECGAWSVARGHGKQPQQTESGDRSLERERVTGKSQDVEGHQDLDWSHGEQRPAPGTGVQWSSIPSRVGHQWRPV